MQRRTFLAMSSAFAIAPMIARTETVPFPPPPELRAAKGYLSISHVETFNGPRTAVIETLQSTEGGVLAFAEPTPAIPQIERLSPVQGSFPQPGAIRQVFLSDGSHVTERVLRNDEDAFAYQLWDINASTDWALDHIRGEFRYLPEGPAQTRVEWTYSVAPSVFIARPFVRRYLNRDFRPFLVSGLSGAADAFNRTS